jgi:hypothetical protein
MARARALADNHAIVRDTSRLSHPDTSRHKARNAMVKRCLGCPHWSYLHPEHGPCVGWYQTNRWHRDLCTCTKFQDPEPGRPDMIYTRYQIETMRPDRWEPRKHLIYLMKDGRYGLLDKWTDKEKYFA